MESCAALTTHILVDRAYPLTSSFASTSHLSARPRTLSGRLLPAPEATIDGAVPPFPFEGAEERSCGTVADPIGPKPAAEQICKQTPTETARCHHNFLFAHMTVWEHSNRGGGSIRGYWETTAAADAGKRYLVVCDVSSSRTYDVQRRICTCQTIEIDHQQPKYERYMQWG